jgi:hypothetical protein
MPKESSFEHGPCAIQRGVRQKEEEPMRVFESRPNDLIIRKTLESSKLAEKWPLWIVAEENSSVAVQTKWSEESLSGITMTDLVAHKDSYSFANGAGHVVG